MKKHWYFYTCLQNFMMKSHLWRCCLKKYKIDAPKRVFVEAFWSINFFVCTRPQMCFHRKNLHAYRKKHQCFLKKKILWICLVFFLKFTVHSGLYELQLTIAFFKRSSIFYLILRMRRLFLYHHVSKSAHAFVISA